MRRFQIIQFAFVAYVATSGLLFGGDKAVGLKPEDIVAKHLDAIGTSQARAAVKSRWVQGPAEYKVIVGGAGGLSGKGVIVSQDRKFQLLLKFSDNLYRGEQFIFDGSRVQVTGTTGNQSRSAFGEFVRTQDTILKEGLLGGELSTAWALNDVGDRKSKLEYQGLKTIDGRQLHDLRYRPKKSTDVEVHIYFDPETFRHVMTVYTVSIRAGLGYVDPQGAQPSDIPGAPSVGLGGQGAATGETTTARQQDTRYRIEERFSDFKTADGLTLPTNYDIHFSAELQNGKTTVTEWTVNAEQIDNPPAVDPRNFVVK